MRRLGVAFAIAAALLLLVSPASAFADATGPAITNVLPADGSDVPSPLTISAHLVDVDLIDSAATSLTVDGVAYPLTFSWGRHFEGTGCSVHEVIEYDNGDVSASLPPLPVGTHAARIGAVDRAGNTSSYSWTLYSPAPLSFSGHVPAPDQNLITVSRIQVSVEGTLAPASVLMEIDGSAATCTVEVIDATHARVIHDGPMYDGTHTVRVSASDPQGDPPAHTSWMFANNRLWTGPLISAVVPTDGSSQQGTFTVSAHAEDPQRVDGSNARLTVDGVAYPPATVSYRTYFVGVGCQQRIEIDETVCDLSFRVPDLPAGRHEATLTAVDVLGISSSSSFHFFRTSAIRFSEPTPPAGSHVPSATGISLRVDGGPPDPARLQVWLDGLTVPAVYTPLDTTSGVVAFPALLGQGSHTATVSIGDTAGNLPSVHGWSFSVDAVAPIVSVSPSSVVTQAAAGLTVTVTDEDAVDPASIRVASDGTTLTPLVVTSSSAASVTVAWQGIFSDGDHRIHAEARDAAGNTGSYDATLTVKDEPAPGAPSPAAGSLVGTSTPIRVPFSDTNDALVTTSAEVLIDGRPIEAVAVPTDSRHVTVCATATALSDGPHTATARISDALGNTGTKAWTFGTDAVGPVLDASSPLPAAGSVLATTHVGISAHFSDPNEVDPARTVVRVDGRTVASTAGYQQVYVGSGCDAHLEPVLTALQVWAPDVRLGSAVHEVQVDAYDKFGNMSTATWTFTVREYPFFCSLSPSSGATTTALSLAVAATILDYDGIATPTVGIRWREANMGHPAGQWHEMPVNVVGADRYSASFAATSSEMRFEFEFSATDLTGLVATATSNVFIVSKRAGMPSPSSCRSCHATILSTHPMANCVACHPGDPSGPCSCHHATQVHTTNWLTGVTLTGHGGDYTGRSCPDCHNVHSNPENAGLHLVGSPPRCDRCHARTLTTAHQGVTASDGPMTCLTCHTSTDATVTAAISSGNASCGACHAATANGHEAAHPADYSNDPSCARCHSGDLITEHVMRQKLDCGVCHAEYKRRGSSIALSALKPPRVSTPGSLPVAASSLGTVSVMYADPSDVASAVVNGVTSCSACHAPMPHGIRTDCETCHGYTPPTTDGTEPTTTAPGYAPATVPTDSPHQGYALSTVKCAVCHSVHKAPAGGEVLLRGTAQTACEYCHVYTNLGGIVVYGGDVANYYAVDDHFGHNRNSRSSCVNCHSVHGAGVLAGAKRSKLLWDWSGSGRSTYSTPALAAWPDPVALGNGDAQITAWCTGCHAYYAPSYDATLSVQLFDHATSYEATSALRRSHVMTDLAGGFADPAGTIPTGTPVAWTGSEYCRSCHDAGRTDEGPGSHADSFPHYTVGYWRFMSTGESGESSGQPNATPQVDGLCLKCHKASALVGVGEGF